MHFLENPNLSLKAKGLLCVALQMKYFSVKALYDYTNDGETAIRSAIKELIENGYCTHEYIYENGKRAGVDYSFTEISI